MFTFRGKKEDGHPKRTNVYVSLIRDDPAE